MDSVSAAQFILSARPAGSRRGRPRMTIELKEAGRIVGERRACPIACLSCRLRQGHGRGPAAQFGQIGDSRVILRKRH